MRPTPLSNRASNPEAFASSSAAGPELCVLIVDDSTDYSASLAELVRSWGYRAEIARSASQALDRFDQAQPRIVMLDLGLPDMHGYELAKLLRQRALGRKLHFVVVTGWSQIADQLSSNAAGISHHLVKPVNFVVLREILAAYRAVEERATPVHA